MFVLVSDYQPAGDQPKAIAKLTDGVPLASPVRMGYFSSVMKRTAHKRKKLDYPDVTNGTRWAAEARRLASKLTPEEEAKHFARAMVKIYGGKPKEIAGAGH